MVIYKIITDILIWIPITILWILTKPLSNKQVIFNVIITAVIIEFCQLFVISRYTDVTDIVTATIGAYLGVYFVTKFRLINRPTVKKNTKDEQYIKWTKLGFVALVIWLIILIFVYWYPFDFRIENKFISTRINSFFSVPFSSYYYGSEYLAITQLLRKIIFGLPLGFSLALVSLLHTSFNLHTALKILYSFILLEFRVSEEEKLKIFHNNT